MTMSSIHTINYALKAHFEDAINGSPILSHLHCLPYKVICIVMLINIILSRLYALFIKFSHTIENIGKIYNMLQEISYFD